MTDSHMHIHTHVRTHTVSTYACMAIMYQFDSLVSSSRLEYGTRAGLRLLLLSCKYQLSLVNYTRRYVNERMNKCMRM